MLKTIVSSKDAEVAEFCCRVRFTDRLTDVSRRRMEQIETVCRWLAERAPSGGGLPEDAR